MKVVAPTEQQLAIRGRILDWVSERADIPQHSISLTMPVYEVGLSSADIVELTGELGEHYGLDIPPDTVFEFPSIALLAAHIASRLSPGAEQEVPEESTVDAKMDDPVAVIGLGCRFPAGIHGPERLWDLLVSGRDVIGRVPRGRWDFEKARSTDVATLVDGPAGLGGFLDDIAAFDPGFFGISPNEANAMDPQQRIALEVAIECLDHAGVTPATLSGSTTGIFMGASSADYVPDDLSTLDGWAATGASMGIVANRISYALGTRGPTMTVDTACSSSLVAVHLAVQSLRAGDCDIALAGGVNVLLSPAVSVAFTRSGVLSSDGRCKTFDADADGYSRSEGCGMVALKRLSDAVRDGDRVLAVIRGSAVGSNGQSNGLMAPHPGAQEELLRTAYRNAGVEPGSVDFVEAHGTGTTLGDAVELSALQAVMTAGRDPAHPLRLGAVKTNLGHLEAAAGIAGLIKTVLSLWHERLPGNLNYATPNAKLAESDGLLDVVRDSVAWPRRERPRLAGISSFGFGGTNAHVVVEEAPQEAEEPRPRGSASVLLAVATLSASSAEAVRADAEAILSTLRDGAEPDVADIAHTLTLRRAPGRVRAAIAADTADELCSALEALARGRAHGNVVTGTVRDNPTPVFVFSGQGSQWIGMGRELLDEPAFADVIEELEPIIAEESGFSLLEVLRSDDQHTLDSIDVVQPVLFAVQVALAETWRAHGVTPSAVIGHSMGEVAAAAVAGALSLTDAARVTCRRSRALRGIAGRGAMAMIAAGEAVVQNVITEEALGEDVTVGVVPSPSSTVVSGSVDGIERLVKTCTERGLDAVKVQVDVASHSSQVDDILDDIRADLAEIVPKEPTIPVYSTVSGHRLDRSTDAEYWADNLRQPVLLADAVSAAAADGHSVFIEVSPHPILVRPVTDTLAAADTDGQVFGTLHREQRDGLAFSLALAHLHCLGGGIRWPSSMAKGRLVALPPRAWNHRRYWRDRTPLAAPASAEGHPLLGTFTVPADEPRTRIWQLTMDPVALGWPAAHRVAGTPVAPASYALGLLTVAGRECGYDRPSARAVTFHAPIPAEGPIDVQIICRRDDATDTAEARTFYRPVGSLDWTLSVSARFEPAGRGKVEAPPMSEGSEVVTGDDLYAGLAAHAIEYGPELRCVTTMRGDGRAAAAQLDLPRLTDSHGQYPLHPVLIDGAMQLAGTVLEETSGVSIVAAVDAWTVLRPGRPDRAQAFRREPEPNVVDVVLSDEDGPLAMLGGVRFAPTGTHAAAPTGTRTTPSTGELAELAYQLAWRPAPASPRPPQQETWLLLGADSSLLDTLRQRGVRCYRMRGEPTADELLDQLHASEPIDRIVSLTPVSVEDADPQEALKLVRDAVATLRALSTVDDAPRLHYVTRHAVQTATDDTAPQAAQAALWGFGRTAALEYPDHWGGTLDLDETDTRAVAEALLKELVGSTSVLQIARRRGKRLQPRLVTAPAPEPATSLGEGTHLVVGGTGRLGSLLVRELVAAGAECVVVASRRGGFGPLTDEVETLRESGTQIVEMSFDVRDPDSVTAVGDRFGRDLPELRRVYHCAFDGSIADIGALSDAQVDTMFATKATGMANLRHLVAEHRGADVVCFSSTAGLLGSVGLAHCAAASTYLDALAGSGVRVVGFGPIDHGMDGGEQDEALRVPGLRTLNAGVLRSVVRGLSDRWPESPVAIVDAEWSFVAQAHASGNASLTADPVAGKTGTAGKPVGSGGALADAVRSASPEDRSSALLAYLRHVIAGALGMSPAELDERQNLYQVGMDSLMTVMVIRTISTELGYELLPTVVRDNPTLQALAEHLARQSLPKRFRATGKATA